MTQPTAPQGSLGVLGGMGPAATSDFLARVASATPAQSDQEHIPVILYANPRTPDRSDAWERGDDAPLSYLLTGVNFLSVVGVCAIAIPCNSAHLWYDRLQESTDVPIIHIADALTAKMTAELPCGSAVGLLGTTGTLRSGFYQRRLDEGGLTPLLPSSQSQSTQVMGGIRALKSGDVSAARELLLRACEDLIVEGASAIAIMCTDASAALADVHTIAGCPAYDASSELARSSVRSVREANGGIQAASDR